MKETLHKVLIVVAVTVFIALAAYLKWGFHE
jgi:preprotein translocase subunit SecE